MKTLKQIKKEELVINLQGNEFTKTYEDLVNDCAINRKTVCVNVGDMITCCNGQGGVVTHYEYIGSCQGIIIHTDNGEKINTRKMQELIDRKIITVN